MLAKKFREVSVEAIKEASTEYLDRFGEDATPENIAKRFYEIVPPRWLVATMQYPRPQLGKISMLFTVSFVQRRMNEDGSVTSITNPDPGEKFATPHLRIYPRRVVLKPGESQIVILQRRRSNNIEDGEYRSHLSFLSLPNITPLKNLTPVIEKDSITFSTNLTTSFSISIPIILRYGKPNVSSYISDLKLEGTQLRFNINRKGNVSIYGDFLIQYIPEEGEPFSILNSKGVGVYTTIEKRKMTFNLDKTTNIDFNKGSLKVIFKAPSGSIQEVFAEKTLLLKQ